MVPQGLYARKVTSKVAKNRCTVLLINSDKEKYFERGAPGVRDWKKLFEHGGRKAPGVRDRKKILKPPTTPLVFHENDRQGGG